MDIFDKKNPNMIYTEINRQDYQKHIIYLEFCISLAQKNRMGLINITKNLTFD